MMQQTMDELETDDAAADEAVERVDVVVVGAGPNGLAAAIATQQAGYRTVVVDSGCIVNAIAGYPTHMTFFSTSEKIAIGGLPFPHAGEKPTRDDAMAYYRTVVEYFRLTVRQYETVERVARQAERFRVDTRTRAGVRRTLDAGAVVLATGYFGHPNLLGIPGEDLPHVTHIFKEGHCAFQQNAVVVGGGNSAVDAALELYRVHARVTLVHFADTLDPGVKPWVLPDITNRIKEGSIAVRWGARVTAITPSAVELSTPQGAARLPADHVFLMTGFAPNTRILESLGVPVDADTGIPAHDPETMETSVLRLFIAGVVASGKNANRIFIENGREHGPRIARQLAASGFTPHALP
ncbi:MAG TPA: YpdA family putative bacillithiol disulfide reductase [Gemmatimonadaceae bacterium]|nr:YpdA family putative bacillithiol disulfide reductase [Gemmatimonadaceae bacterium]